MTKPSQPPRNPSKAMIVGMVVAAALVGVLVVVGSFSRGFGDAVDASKVEVTKNNMVGAVGGRRLYFARFEKLPTEREGLQAVVGAKFLPEVTKDGWGRPLGYRLDGDGVVLTSLGSDGAPGGEGTAADLEHRWAPKSK